MINAGLQHRKTTWVRRNERDADLLVSDRTESKVKCDVWMKKNGSGRKKVLPKVCSRFLAAHRDFYLGHRHAI
jgi:hypothetical protein